MQCLPEEPTQHSVHIDEKGFLVYIGIFVNEVQSAISERVRTK